MYYDLIFQIDGVNTVATLSTVATSLESVLSVLEFVVILIFLAVTDDVDCVTAVFVTTLVSSAIVIAAALMNALVSNIDLTAVFVIVVDEDFECCLFVLEVL